MEEVSIHAPAGGATAIRKSRVLPGIERKVPRTSRKRETIGPQDERIVGQAQL